MHAFVCYPVRTYIRTFVALFTAKPLGIFKIWVFGVKGSRRDDELDFFPLNSTPTYNLGQHIKNAV